MRPSHLLMSRPVNRLLWLSGPTRPGVWRPLRPLYQELLSKRFVMRQAGPHRTHSSGFILWTWTLPQVPRCSRPSAAHLISTGQALVAMVMLYWRSQSVSDVMEFPWKGTFSYDCNLSSLKRERTLRPRPYLLCACKQLAQTFLAIDSFFWAGFIASWFMTSPALTCSRLITQSVPKAFLTQRSFSLQGTEVTVVTERFLESHIANFACPKIKLISTYTSLLLLLYFGPYMLE